jgi:hypothetical protein
MQDKKTYKFKCGIEASQEELTLGKSKQLAKAVMGIDIDKVSMQMKIEDAIRMLSDTGLINELLDIVLTVIMKPGEASWDDLTVTEVSGIVEDFFTFNPGLGKLFGIGKLNQATASGSATIN